MRQLEAFSFCSAGLPDTSGPGGGGGGLVRRAGRPAAAPGVPVPVPARSGSERDAVGLCILRDDAVERSTNKGGGRKGAKGEGIASSERRMQCNNGRSCGAHMKPHNMSTVSHTTPDINSLTHSLTHLPRDIQCEYGQCLRSLFHHGAISILSQDKN
jgi:hypothetical protein